MSGFFGCTVDSLADRNDVSEARIATLLAIMKPKPSPFEFIRVGGRRDGAYLLPNDLNGVTDCFSPGVNGIKHFEDELAISYSIRSHMIDASCSEADFETPLIDGLQDFKPLWLDTHCSEHSVTLAAWMDNSVSPQAKDCILQMDIEGAEYRNILATDDEVLGRFRIIVMELHEVPYALLEPLLFLGIMEPFLQKLDKQFICIHAHPNNYYRDVLIPAPLVRVPRLLELVFLRRDRYLMNQSRRNLPVALPHHLDIVNVPDRPPLHLDSYWSSSRPMLMAKFTMLSMWMIFFRSRLLIFLGRMLRFPPKTSS